MDLLLNKNKKTKTNKTLKKLIFLRTFLQPFNLFTKGIYDIGKILETELSMW